MIRRVFTYFKNEIKAIRNGKAFVFFVCLALASFLWFLNALEKHYTDHITVPVKYVNVPKNKDLTGILPDKLDLNVDALGYTLLRYKLRLAFSPLILDVNELSNNYLENRFLSKYSVSTIAHKEEFAKQISNEISIISVRPDSITFRVSRIIEKLVKIHPIVDLNLAKEYILQKQPVAKPESILVRGPVEILDTLTDINTLVVKQEKLSQSVFISTPLFIPSEINSDIKSVSVQIVVEQCTEARFDIPVLVINQPDSLQIKTFPSKVRISCRVGISEYNRLNSNSFKAIIDYSRRSQTLSKMAVKLEKIPDNVLYVDYSPKEVDFITERK